MRKTAYSIIEILISTFVSVIVLAVSVPTYNFFENFRLKREAYNIMLAIRSAQIKAVNEGITYTTELVNHNSIDNRPFYSIHNYSNSKNLKIYLSDNIRFSKEDAQYISFGSNVVRLVGTNRVHSIPYNLTPISLNVRKTFRVAFGSIPLIIWPYLLL